MLFLTLKKVQMFYDLHVLTHLIHLNKKPERTASKLRAH